VLHIWDLWIPDAGSRGVSFARGVMEPHQVVWVHAPPALLRVEIRDQEGLPVASGDRLERQADLPMARLRMEGERVYREDAWPTQEAMGQPVILPGGEVGILKEWWNDPGGREWRWSVEFYNHR
jgi:hypothetical protein